MIKVFSKKTMVQRANYLSIYWPAFMLGMLTITPLLPPNETFTAPMLIPLGFNTAVICVVLFLCICCAWDKRTRLSSDYVLITLPFVMMILVGLLHAADQNLYLVLKDVWYIFNAAVVVLMGYVIALNLGDIRVLFRTFVITSTLIALYHLGRLALHPDILLLPANQLRDVMGRGYLESCLGLILMLAARRMHLRLFQSRALNILIVTICASSFILSFSRILWLAIILMAGALYSWLDLRRAPRMLALGLLALTLALTLKALPVPKTMDNQSTFLDKVIYSIQEVQVKEYSSLAAINANWRGYESARAEKTFWQGTADQILFGQGFGQQVDLGLYMRLPTELMHYVPILHNGYMYLLVKMGLVGLALYVAFLLMLIYVGYKTPIDSTAVYYVGQLIIALAIFYFLSTNVFGGLLNKYDFQQASLLLGGLLACRRLFLQSGTQQSNHFKNVLN